ncbi:hypothetical protein J6590_082652 [Homalodisca vitripennis]|nr:hypothetical protein J6590_082652 [Homalodisca vitripennis]
MELVKSSNRDLVFPYSNRPTARCSILENHIPESPEEVRPSSKSGAGKNKDSIGKGSSRNTYNEKEKVWFLRKYGFGEGLTSSGDSGMWFSKILQRAVGRLPYGKTKSRLLDLPTPSYSETKHDQGEAYQLQGWE